jgi:hypothetical protein
MTIKTTLVILALLQALAIAQAEPSKQIIQKRRSLLRGERRLQEPAVVEEPILANEDEPTLTISDFPTLYSDIPIPSMVEPLVEDPSASSEPVVVVLEGESVGDPPVAASKVSKSKKASKPKEASKSKKSKKKGSKKMKSDKPGGSKKMKSDKPGSKKMKSDKPGSKKKGDKKRKKATRKKAKRAKKKAAKKVMVERDGAEGYIFDVCNMAPDFECFNTTGTGRPACCEEDELCPDVMIFCDGDADGEDEIMDEDTAELSEFPEIIELAEPLPPPDTSVLDTPP